MKRKIVQTGSSLAVTLPADIVAELRLKKGDEVDVTVHPQTGAIVVRAVVAYLDDGRVTPRFRQLATDLRRRRRRLYTELAK